MAEKTKPTIKVIIDYLQGQIPGCGISDSEIEAFKPVYDYSSWDQLAKAFHSAINKQVMQPLSYMTSQLRVIKPPVDPFNPQISTQSNQNRRWAYKRRVEIGTDWDAKNAEIQAKRDAQRQAYDRVHGTGAFDAKVHAKTVELQRIFKTLTNK